MNILALVTDLKKINPTIDLDIEVAAQSIYSNQVSKFYKDAPMAWLVATLEALDKHGYVVKKSQNAEYSQVADNVFKLKGVK